MGGIWPEATWDTASENGYSVFVRWGERGLIEQMNAPRGKMTHSIQSNSGRTEGTLGQVGGEGFFFSKYRSPCQAGECQS